MSRKEWSKNELHLIKDNLGRAPEGVEVEDHGPCDKCGRECEYDLRRGDPDIRLCCECE